MPILGIMASAISGNLFAPSGAYDSIATTTVGSGGAATITFSSIPATYQHLQLRMLTRGTGTSGFTIDTIFNNDSGSNYGPSHYLEGDGSAVAAGVANSASTTKITTFASPKSNSTASVFGGFIVDILDYANTSKYKTLRHFGGFDGNGSGFIDFDSGLWMSTSAINRIDITTGGTSFAQYSSFALYGIKGA
jgi:hypothetical protein